VTQSTHIFHCAGPDERRLDHFLSACLPQYSRARLQGLIKQGLVHLDGVPAHKNGQMVGAGTVVRVVIPSPLPAHATAEKIPLDIVYEDDNVLVVNKAAGMVVHPAAGHWTGTLVNAALGYAPGLQAVGGEERPGIVHRLDKATSGLIVMAKNDDAHHWLQDRFRLRGVRKIYLALVDGKPPTASGRIEAAIGRDPARRKQMAIVPADKGREAITEYRTLETFPKHTYLEFHPVTGRTHQIRVHAAFLKCPVVGDRVYGPRNPSLLLDRHFLHAAKLIITLPGQIQPRSFEAPLPDELQQILASLRPRRPLGQDE
jgi:23S rRNA pseudouridine1911/1915/1917 synthase